MRSRHVGVLGGVTASVLLSPNILWEIYIPALVLLGGVLVGVARWTKKDVVLHCGALVCMVAISVLAPSSVKYNVFFYWLVLLYHAVAKLWKYKSYRRGFVVWGAAFLLVGIVIESSGYAEGWLHTRPTFDQHLLSGILRQRGLFTEPAHLGYWAALLSILAWLERNGWAVAMGFAALVLSASAGAILFFVALVIVQMRNMSNMMRVGGGIAIVLLIAVMWPIIEAKIGLESASLSARLMNAKEAIDYITTHFPNPDGFGPMRIDGMEFGITSFLLMVPKALGIFSVLVLSVVWSWRRRPITLLPAMVIAAAVGNYWETPILFYLFLIPFFNRGYSGSGAKGMISTLGRVRSDNRVFLGKM